MAETAEYVKSGSSEIGRVYLDILVKDFQLPHKNWVQLNCIRTGKGRYNELLAR